MVDKLYEAVTTLAEATFDALLRTPLPNLGGLSDEAILDGAPLASPMLLAPDQLSGTAEKIKRDQDLQPFSLTPTDEIRSSL